MCILLQVKLLWCGNIPYISGQLEGGRSALSICAFCYMLNIFGLVGFHRSMVHQQGGLGHIYILLSVKLIWCSGIPYIYGQLDGGTYALSISAFCYLLNVFRVLVFHRSVVIWKRGALVYVHSAICKHLFGVAEFHTSMDSVQWYTLCLWSIAVGVQLHSVYVHCAIC